MTFSILATFAACQARATVVRFDSVLGAIDVRLFDAATPISTQNIINYINDGDYEDNFVHRSVPGFIIQAGGFNFPEGVGVQNVPTDPPILNEFGITNIRGTIAYAKVGPPEGQPPNPTTINSATSGFFFNLADNASNLDNQNGGFTVFGRVVGNGMAVADAIANLPRVNAGGAFTTLPVIDFQGGTIFRENLALFNDISILTNPDADYTFNGVVSNADLVVWETDFGSALDVEADGNGSGVVDGSDFLIWQQQLVTSGALHAATAVPEPTTLLLAALTIGLPLAVRRRRH
ncbi:MAG: peptidylprolyl isomerase [Lacipirellulaceae bacterium]